MTRRTGARYVALPAISATLFLREAKRSTEAELVKGLEEEAAALRRELPGVTIGFLEPVPSAEVSLADAIADRPWIDWIAAAPFPGTVPVKELELLRERLAARGAAGKLALFTAAPLIPSRYWPWHEAEHAALVTLASRYARSRALRFWMHAPIRSFEPYGFRRQRGVLATTAPLEALSASLR